MISSSERAKLYNSSTPGDCIGFDCEGRHIKEGMLVEVVIADEFRAGNPKYAYCDVGCRGQASRHHSFPIGWMTMVRFGKISVGCVDFHLRIVGQ